MVFPQMNANLNTGNVGWVSVSVTQQFPPHAVKNVGLR